MMANCHSDLAGQVRQLVPARAAAERYGFVPNRAGYICCPFHREKTPSLKLFDDGGWKCFGCGEGGSAIDFVMKLFDISFPQALLRLDADFGLGLTGRRPGPGQREKLRELEAARRERERNRSKLLEEIRKLSEDYRRMHQNMQLYRPEGPGIEDFHPLFAEALRCLTPLEWRLEELENKLREAKS